MSIRFKFRSAASYDEVAIGEKRDSITVRELKARIIGHKNLNLCQDFDLVFSDAVSGQEYNEDDFQIPSGSSVIIKRVPAGMMPSAPAPVSGKKVDSCAGDSKFMNPANEHLDDFDDFDDFGADLCPLPDANFAAFDLEFDKKRSISNEEAEPACWRSGLQKPELSELSQAIDKGSVHNENNRDLPQGPMVNEQIKLEKIKNPAKQSSDLPSELKCSLCSKFFKDAVMIPCCQHSFCEKCICGVLVGKGRCPKCSSSKYKVENLLPNLSLRQAIEHFLESQMLTDGSENDLCKYVPDGESGIQAIDVSCAVTVVQREPELPHSPTATGKGSNQILSESFYESLTRKNTSFVRSGYHLGNLVGARGMNSALQKAAKQIDKGRGVYDHNLNVEVGCENLKPDADLVGENQPPPLLQDEADSSFKEKRAMWLEKGGGDQHLSTAGRHNKGVRTCFMCGSPHHFIKDCPVAPNVPSMFQRGNCPPGGGFPSYTSPYWNATTLPPYGPFGNMYGNPGMMSYNTSMVPIAPLAVPPCVPAMYGGLPTPRGNMGMQTMGRPGHSDYEIQQPEKRMKLSNDYLDRGHSNAKDDFHGHFHFNKVERSDNHKFHGQEPSDSYSHDSSGQRFKKKRQHEMYNGSKSHAIDERYEKSSRSSHGGRDRRPYPSERSNSEIEHKPRNSGRHGEEGEKHHNKSSKKHHPGREQSDCDSSWSRHKNQKDSRRVELDLGGSHRKHNSYSGPGLEPSRHFSQRSRDKENDSAHDCRRSMHRAKRTCDEVQGDRWQMVSGSDEDCRDNYRYQSASGEVCRDNYRHHKRRRAH